MRTISSKGQVTLPSEIRNRLGLKEGDRIEFVAERGVTILRPARQNQNRFEAYAGVLDTFPNGVKEINAWIRDLRDESDDEQP
ncbi:MAG: AbrB/MazE/SpoVT family DNA-binding domain-containing protein [Bryobacteraceae bacterium]